MLAGITGPHVVQSQEPVYVRPPVPPKSSVLDLRLRYLFRPDVSFQGLGNVPFAESFSSPGNILTGSQRSIFYHDGAILQDYQQLTTAGGTLLTPTQDGLTANFSYSYPEQRVDENTLAYHRYAASADPDMLFDARSSGSMGWELNYTRYFDNKRTLGLQVGFSFNGFDSRYNDTITGTLHIEEYLHKMQPGQTAPHLPPPVLDDQGMVVEQPEYTGNAVRTGDGQPLIEWGADGPNSSDVVDGATITTEADLRAAIYAFRAGPTYYLNLGRKFHMNLGAGVSAIYFSGQFSALETLDVPGGVSAIARTRTMTDDADFQFGGYLDASAGYRFTDRVSLFSGMQYQGGSGYNQRNDERSVNVDFSTQIYLHAGLGIRF
jgi:hypothetical protein